MEVERKRHDRTCLLESINQNTACQGNDLVTIHDFIRINPPIFRHSTEPLDTNDWLRSIECKLHSVNVTTGDRVTFTAYHLEGATSSWWENYEAMHPVDQETSWSDFCEAFREHHILEGLMELK